MVNWYKMSYEDRRAFALHADMEELVDTDTITLMHVAQLLQDMILWGDTNK